MKIKFKFVIAQTNFLVGAIESNANKIISLAQTAKKEYDAQLIIFPELALCGYPPEDLIFREDFFRRVNKAMSKIQKSLQDIDILLGYPHKIGKHCYNAAAFIIQNKRYNY